jgi:hypothetical protein
MPNTVHISCIFIFPILLFVILSRADTIYSMALVRHQLDESGLASAFTLLHYVHFIRLQADDECLAC